MKYVRYRWNGTVYHGMLDGETVHELGGCYLAGAEKTGNARPLADVTLLAPVEPPKILAVARNYGSHLGDAQKPEKPELFYKPVTSLIGPDEAIVIPPGAGNVHYEAELVIVVGKEAKNVSVEDAGDCVFGVSCGNDVSERDWQVNDIQWWRAKGSDTFAPLGPCVARGLDYNDIQLTLRLNGEVKQQQRTNDMFYNVEEIVSFASRFVTLTPGDLIYTGTPGTTSAMKPGDVVEVELEGVGVLRNTVE